MTKCIKVDLKHADGIKKDVLEKGIYNYKFKVKKEANFLYIPVIRKYKNYKLVNKELSNKKKLNFKDLLKERLSEEDIKKIKSSFDVIGDIVILEMDDEFKEKEFVAECLLKCNKNIRSVVKKAGGHEGVFRIQNYEWLAGDKNLETMHKESGVKVKLDVSKTYFTPRLSNERMRIAKLVADGERVLVMFSGVGIYGFIISKHSKAKEIVCVEINPDACEYAEESLKLNKLNNVKSYCGDVRELVNHLGGNFDRIIMPLPKESVKYLDLALSLINNNGIIHLYVFSEEDKINSVVEEIKNKAEIKVLDVAKAGQIKARTYRYCIDFQLLE